MTRHHALVLFFCLVLLFAAGCEQTSIAQQEQIKSFETLQASTPSVTPIPTETPIPTGTPTPTPTLTPTPTTGPSPTPSPTLPPTVTPIPSPTPLPPSPTPNPALANFSLCNQTAGEADGGRFSARITGITTTVEPVFERLTIALAVPSDSAAPHATARCLSAADLESRGGAVAGVGDYILELDLAGWLHDDAFGATVISPTRALSGTTVLKSLTYGFDQNAPAGAVLLLGMEQPLPFHFTLEKNPYRLVLEVAKTATVSPSSDMLSLATTTNVQPDAPLFYLQDGDVWKFAGGKATNLTTSAEVETGLAVSTATQQVAFCRVAPGADVGDRGAPSALWIMDLDGNDPRLLAAPGLSCAEPAFSPDGSQIAFTVDETGAIPARLSIWTVPVGGGEQRLTSANDEWSRFAPQWVDDDRLVYAAVAEDGRSTLFVHSASGTEQDIGAELVKGDRYRALSRPLVAPDGSAIAVEGLRANADGADLLLLDPNGVLQNQSPIGGGYWSRPLAWSADGTLFYLTSACPSEVAQSYTLRTRALKSGDDRIIATGITLGGFGHFAAVGKGLAYVTLDHVSPGPRGELALDRESPSALWFWDVAGSGARVKLVTAQTAIGDLAP